MDWRLTFPSRWCVCFLYFTHTLSLGICSLKPASLAFRGFSLHLNGRQARQKSEGGSAVRCVAGLDRAEHHLGPHELEQPTEHFWAGSQGVIPAQGVGEKKKNHTQNTVTLRLQLPLLCGTDSYGSIDIESPRRTVLLLGWLKISKCRFIMTGADKFAGEMQAVSLSCWRPVLINWWGKKLPNMA